MAQTTFYNIPRDVKDGFYRYKMPKIVSKIEGRGNGIKTVIPNMSDVGKALDRPPAYTTKFFGCELGALVSVDVEKDRFLVNGSHDAEKLQKTLDVFITKFVLCGSCRNPETDLSISKDERITRVCKACGARTPVDLTHKLCAYIIKNPPKKKSKKNGDAPPSPPPDENRAADEEDHELLQLERELPDQPVDDEDWAAETSAEAVAKRMKELAVQPAVLGDDEDEIEDPAEGLATYLSENPDASDADIVAEAISLGIRDYKAVVVLVQVLFNDKIMEQVPKRVSLLKSFVKPDDEKAQKGLLGALERIIGLEYSAQLMKKTPLIFKMFYDLDLLEEDVILQWGSKVSKKYVNKAISQEIHEAAEPFVNWLRVAEHDDDTDDEE